VRIYWYWPFVHAEDLVVPDAVPGPDDTLIVHVMEGRVPNAALQRGRVEVWPTLATVGPEREGSVRWALARSRTYVRRSFQRRKALRNGAFDICHVRYLNYFTDWLDLRLLARRAALVLEVHDVNPHQARLPRTVEHWLLAQQYGTPSIVLARHPYVRSALIERFGVDPSRIEVVPLYVPELPQRCAAEPSVWSDKQSTVLFFGTLRRNKGVDVLLRAIDALCDRRDIRFVFAGRGFSDIEHAITEAARADARITFERGYVSSERKHALYASAQLVVLPYTEFSSSSGVLSDAYAHRVPVVASDVGALAETVRDDGTGWLVPPGDAGALARAISQAIDDAEARRHASDRAAITAADRAAAKIGARLREVYERALQQP
jgi:glycosyltransferase involved in cell wall biosynthesis